MSRTDSKAQPQRAERDGQGKGHLEAVAVDAWSISDTSA
jgi:hypothetical protein